MNFLETNKWIVKWGFLGLKKNESNKENNDILKKLTNNDVANIFNKSANIFDIKIEEQNKTINRAFGYIGLSEPINLSIKIPKRDIKKSDISSLSEENTDYGTEFNVLYNGYFYIIYRKIDSTKKVFRGDWQIRELLEKVIDESDDYQSESIPPTPFREKLFINFSVDKDIQSVKLEKVEGNKVEIVLPEELSIENFFREFYHHTHVDFLKYFLTLRRVKKLEKIERNINQLFMEITMNCLSLQNLQFYQFHNKRKLNQKIKTSIADQFIQFSKYQSIFKDYTLNKEQSLLEISNNQFFENYIYKFKKEIEYNGVDFESIHSLINYSKDVIAAHEGNINYLIGAFIGGFFTIIGVLIGKMI